MTRMARHNAAVWLCLLIAAAAGNSFAAIVSQQDTHFVGLYRGTAKVLDVAGGWAACEAEKARRIAAEGATRTTGANSYECKNERRVTAVTYGAAPPPPSPVDCATSDWSAWSGGAWSACAAGTQTRLESRSRSITTQPANGGAACPALTDSRVASQACTVPTVSAGLSWSAVTQNIDGTPLSSVTYLVESSPNWEVIATSAAIGYVVAAAPVGTCWRVRAVASTGTSAPSNQVCKP